MLRPADAFLTHPWFVRITGALTIAGILNGLADRVFDFSTIPLIATLVGAFLLSLSGIAFAQRHYSPATRVPEDPAALVRRYSDWLLKVRAALPDSPNTMDIFVPMPKEHREQRRAANATAHQQYRQTYGEVERQARIEYHDRFRVGVLAIVGNGHEQANDPRTIEDLEAVEKLLLAAKPADPQVAEFKHFAQQFAGWLKSHQPAPADLRDFLGDDYEDEVGMQLAKKEITETQHANLVQPFVEYRKWEDGLRSDYQLNKRADVIRWRDWAREMRATTGPDLAALVLAEHPRTPEEFDEIAAAFERIAERL